MKVIRSLFNKDNAVEALLFLRDCSFEFSTLESEILEFFKSYFHIHETTPSFEYVYDEYKRKSRSDVLAHLDDLRTDPEYKLEDLKDYILKLNESKRDSSFNEVLKATKAIAKHGETINGKKLEGTKDAISYLEREIQKLKGDSSKTNRNAGRLKFEVANIQKNYDYLKNNPSARFGLTTGYEKLDEAFKGGRKKELYLLLGYTGSGKSIFTVNYFYNVTHVLRRDAVFYSLEMSEEYVFSMICAIHSASERFDSVRPSSLPLEVSKIYDALLNKEEEDFFKNYVLKDLKTNPKYGNLIVRYPGDTFTMDYMKADMAELSKDYDLEMFGVDHPQLIRQEKGKGNQSHSEFMNDVMKDLKQVCMTWKNGEGIFGFCPYQASRDGFMRAQKNGGVYDLLAASYSNEAERSADGFWYVWKEPGMPTMKVGCLKFRRGRMFDPIELSINWDSTYITDKVVDDLPVVDPLVDFDI